MSDIVLLYSKSGTGKTFYVKKFVRDNNNILVQFFKPFDDLKVPHNYSIVGKKFVYLIHNVDQLTKKEILRVSSFLKKVQKMKLNVFLECNNLKKVSKSITKFCDKRYFGERNVRQELIKKKYPNTKHFIEQTQNTFAAIRTLLYERDRHKVYNVIQDIPINRLYMLLFETLNGVSDEETIKCLRDFNQCFKIINQKYLYSLFAFNLPVQTKALSIRYPKRGIK